MPTEVIRYINPNSTAGGDGTDPGTAGSTRAFATPQEAFNWIGSTYPNPAASDVLIRLRQNGRSNITSGMTQPSLTTDATRFVIWEPHANGHTGIRDLTKDGFDYTTVSGALAQPGYKLRLQGLVTRYSGTSRNGGCVFGVTPVNGAIIESVHCIHDRNAAISLEPEAGNESISSAFLVNAASGSIVRTVISASVFTGPWWNALRVSNIGNASSRAIMYNATIVDCFGGFEATSASVAGRMFIGNNRVERRSGSSRGAYVLAVSPSGRSSTNMSDDATSPQTGFRNLTGTFVDAGAGDYTPTGADPGIAAGTDLSADAEFAFSTDLKGDAITDWMIGALAPAAGPSGPSAAAKAHYRRNNLFMEP